MSKGRENRESNNQPSAGWWSKQPNKGQESQGTPSESRGSGFRTADDLEAGSAVPKKGSARCSLQCAISFSVRKENGRHCGYLNLNKTFYWLKILLAQKESS